MCGAACAQTLKGSGDPAASTSWRSHEPQELSHRNIRTRVGRSRVHCDRSIGTTTARAEVWGKSRRPGVGCPAGAGRRRRRRGPPGRCIRARWCGPRPRWVVAVPTSPRACHLGGSPYLRTPAGTAAAPLALISPVRLQSRDSSFRADYGRAESERERGYISTRRCSGLAQQVRHMDADCLLADEQGVGDL